MLRHSFSWHQLTVIAALEQRRFYFHFVHGAISAGKIIGSLKTLRAIIGSRLLVGTDCPSYRSKAVATYLESLKRGIVVERLPGYAPEINPTEYI